VHLETSFAEARAAGNEPDTGKLALYGALTDRQRRALPSRLDGSAVSALLGGKSYPHRRSVGRSSIQCH
jgi:hypothetical protein